MLKCFFKRAKLSTIFAISTYPHSDTINRNVNFCSKFQNIYIHEVITSFRSPTKLLKKVLR